MHSTIDFLIMILTNQLKYYFGNWQILWFTQAHSERLSYIFSISRSRLVATVMSFTNWRRLNGHQAVFSDLTRFKKKSKLRVHLEDLYTLWYNTWLLNNFDLQIFFLTVMYPRAVQVQNMVLCTYNWNADFLNDAFTKTHFPSHCMILEMS